MSVVNKGIRRALAIAARSATAEEALSAPLRGTPFGVQRALERYVPPRGTPARVADLVTNPDVRERMSETIARGVEDGGHLWYDTAPILASFIKTLGRDEGVDAFKTYMNYVAASSPRSSVGENIRNASYYYHLDRTQQPFPFQPPSPYGHFAGATHRPFLERVRAGEPLGDPATASKVTSFAENLTGNQIPTTVDSHAFALPAMYSGDPRLLKTTVRIEDGEGGFATMNPRTEYSLGLLDPEEALMRPYLWGGRPRPNEYAALEQFYADLGAEQGLTPAQAQSAAWIAGGDETGLRSAYEPFRDTFMARVRLTAAETGKSEEQVLREMIRGKAPLLSVPVAGALGALAQERDRMRT